MTPLWEPFAETTRTGWFVRAPAVPNPTLDLALFSGIVLTALLGRTDRWRSRPWLVVLMGLVAFGTAATLIARWTAQYVAVGTTSTLFFSMMALAIVILPLIADEVYASIVFGFSSRAPFLEPSPPSPSPSPSSSLAPEPEQFSSWPGYVPGIGGIIVGLVLLAHAPILSPTALMHWHLIGAVVAAIGALSLAQCARPVRWLNVLIGVGLVISPFVFGYGLHDAIPAMIAGLLLMMISTIFADRTPLRAEVHHLD